MDDLSIQLVYFVLSLRVIRLDLRGRRACGAGCYSTGRFGLRDDHDGSCSSEDSRHIGTIMRCQLLCDLTQDLIDLRCRARGA